MTLLPFRTAASSFFWLFLFFDLLFSSLTLPPLLFHLSILSEVWLLNFLWSCVIYIYIYLIIVFMHLFIFICLCVFFIFLIYFLFIFDLFILFICFFNIHIYIYVTIDIYSVICPPCKLVKSWRYCGGYIKWTQWETYPIKEEHIFCTVFLARLGIGFNGFLGILLAVSYSYWLESICFRLILRYAYIFWARQRFKHQQGTPSTGSSRNRFFPSLPPTTQRTAALAVVGRMVWFLSRIEGNFRYFK